jgi:hypothetical protein
MKFLETHFEEYLNASPNLHPKLEKIFSKFPKKISQLNNFILYGPNGVGKYTQMLKAIKHYSPTELKYEKKISITYNKLPYFLKISDIHYEIDMSLLGCNSKLLWHDIYLQIIDIISLKTDKTGIIVCKYFQEIHNELLEIFYSYMQKNNLFIDLKYIILTEELGFIPDNILNCCEIIHVPRPSKTQYTKCIKNKIAPTIKLNTITNIKSIQCSTVTIIQSYQFICNKIVNMMISIDDMTFLKFRDLIYDIFIYNLNITECIWYILLSLSKKNKIQNTDLSNIMIKTYCFFQYYNNNYRPIYHLENYLLYLVSIIHKY